MKSKDLRKNSSVNVPDIADQNETDNYVNKYRWQGALVVCRQI